MLTMTRFASWSMPTTTPAGITRFLPKIQKPVSTTSHWADVSVLASSTLPMLPPVGLDLVADEVAVLAPLLSR